VGTSLSASFPTTPLTNAERVDIRRFCGYDMYGPGNSGFVGDRFFVAYGLMEYRMTNAAAEELQVMRLYLSNLYGLESAIPAAGATLNVDTAAVFKRNANEIRDRRALFDGYRVDFCRFFGVPPGKGILKPGLTFVV
jgi:hypothetical protein